MASIEQRWEDLLEKWEEAKNKLAKAEGILSATQEQLQKEFQVETEEEIQAALDEMSDKVESLKKEFSEIVEELEQVL